MSEQDLDVPRFKAPFGGAICVVTDPRDHRGRRYVVAWAVGMGATSPDYVKEQCRQAEVDDAPLNAVYKHFAGPEDKVGVWITVDQIVKPDNRERVEQYVAAMVAYEEELEAYRKQRAAQPVQHSYTLTFPAKVTVTVKAADLPGVHVALAPVDGQLHHEVQQVSPAFPGTMRLELDRTNGELIATTDPEYVAPPAGDRRLPLSA